MTKFFQWSAFVAIIASTAFAAEAADLSHKDKRYLHDTAEGLMAEVAMGQMAQERAGDPGVKAFGQRMVDDHGRELDQLKQIASQKGTKLPDSPSQKQQKEADKLSKLNGKDFDREYVRYETRDHEKDIKEQREEMKNTADADLKQFATAGLSTVTEHYKLVKKLNGQPGK